MKRAEDITLRDPCVLPHGGEYFTYGTGAAWPGYGCYVSRDLINWDGPMEVFTPPPGHSGTGDWWAPECHEYKGKFYLFASYKSAALDKRRTSIFRADSPLGPFEEIFDINAYHEGWDVIDGTFYVDPAGQPWMVFVHEWTSMPDGVGDFTAAKLSDDLTGFAGEPVPLFKARKLPRNAGNTITDGCWMYRSESGRLIMLWSGFDKSGYCVAQAVSLSGEVTGPWIQCPTLLYRKNSAHVYDGGHGALFYRNDGRLMLGVHSPQSMQPGQHEMPAFFDADDRGASVVLTGDSAMWLRGAGAALWNAVVWAACGVYKRFH